MRIGIVGSEGAKFTPATEKKARAIIRRLIIDADVVVSGACHLGGIDVWAVQEAEKLGVPTKEYPPATLKWEGGFKQRNLKIANNSDMVVCITVKQLPKSYTGMRFPSCYHCATPPGHHVKSGGCWTMKQAAKLGKKTKLVVIE